MKKSKQKPKMPNRKTHKWRIVNAIFVRCPYCGSWKTIQRTPQIGISLYCGTCDRNFELGIQNRKDN